MNVLLCVEELGSDMGFYFTLSANTGSVSPSTCTFNQLLDCIIVTVDPATTGITVCSIGLCTDCITIPVTLLPPTTTTTTAEPTTTTTTTTTTTAEPTTTTTTTTTSTTTTTTADPNFYYNAYLQACGTECEDFGSPVLVQSPSSLTVSNRYSEGTDNTTVHRITSIASAGTPDFTYTDPIERDINYCCT